MWRHPSDLVIQMLFSQQEHAAGIPPTPYSHPFLLSSHAIPLKCLLLCIAISFVPLHMVMMMLDCIKGCCLSFPCLPFCQVSGLGGSAINISCVDVNSSSSHARHEFHETCHFVAFIVLVISHQRWKQTRTAFAFIFGVNWLWRSGVTASFGVQFNLKKK